MTTLKPPRPRGFTRAAARTGGAPCVQLDLFAGDPDVRRLVDGLTCIRDAVPEAMYLLIHLGPWKDRDERRIGSSGHWAYAARRDGFHYEHCDEWWNGARLRGKSYGWNRTPAQVITWDELSVHLGGHPRRADVLAWADALPEPKWQDLYRPHELWPNPDQWNRGYITADHERPGWADRLAAWRALQEICTDAILSAEVAR